MVDSSRRLSGFVVCAFLVLWAVPARADVDVITDWNIIAANTISAAVPPRPGPSSILDFAVVHIAMHDAVQAIEGRYQSYDVPIQNAEGSIVAAAASAAFEVLAARFSAQAGSLAMTLNNYLQVRGLLGDAGVAIGQQAAAAILARRSGDGSFPPAFPPFNGSTEIGQWRPTPPGFASMAAPWLGSVAPFVLDSSDQLRPPPPPHLTSGKYAKDYNEVKVLGRLNSTERTPEQTALALFYSDNFLTLWQRTLRGLAGGSVGDNARMFALANMAAADAIITAWDSKKFFNFWRPITAIQEGNNDGNPKTEGDPTWVPYLVTPPYADYTSGANNLTGSMTRVLALLFGDKTDFDVFSVAANVTKTYHRFSDMADDVVDVRIFQGIHFRTADEVARKQGKHTADVAVHHFLRPVHGKH